MLSVSAGLFLLLRSLFFVTFSPNFTAFVRLFPISPAFGVVGVFANGAVSERSRRPRRRQMICTFELELASQPAS